MDPKVDETKKALDAVSPSFCVAKWKQVTLHLQNGLNHSCHHPIPHPIPLGELARDPAALHNSMHKKLQRKAMLEGKRPKECEYCWGCEDVGHYSDRFLKSSEPWARPHLEEVAQLPWDANVNPSYLEVSFSNTCNFACSYCSPHVSSKWMAEVREHGPYPTSLAFGFVQHPPIEEEANPYIKAFWEWFPGVYPELQTLRVTGGEPLLSRNTFKLLDHVVAEGTNRALELAINSNLGAPRQYIDKLIERINALEGKAARFTLYTSVDTHGKRAEYIRNGLDYAAWLANFDEVARRAPWAQLTLMCTFNALSFFDFERLVDDVVELKRRYPGRIWFDMPYLRLPRHQSAQIMPSEYVRRMVEIHAYMERTGAFNGIELEKAARIQAWMQEPLVTQKYDRADFFRFFSEHDRRRGTDFLATFPELEPFWRYCESLARDGRMYRFVSSVTPALRKIKRDWLHLDR